MSFRVRKSARLGPLRFNFAKSALSSISLGGRRAIGARLAGQLALIETPEAMADTITRARSQDDAKRSAHRCIEAVQEATQLASTRAWLA